MLRFSANLSTLFQELPLKERFEAAARAGFNAVELWFPYEIPATELKAILRDNGLRCVGINSPAGDVGRGDWGLAVDPARRDAFDQSVAQAFDYAAAIDCSNVHVMAGLHQVDHTDQQRDAAWTHYLDCIGAASDKASGMGITVMLEALNAIDRPLYLLQTQRQARQAVTQLERPNLKIMLDLYHLQRGEGNLIESMMASLPFAAHVQIADNPGRHEPGTGEIRYDHVFSVLEASGYDGYIGCEYLPATTATESFSWMHRWLGDADHKLNAR